MAKAENFEDLLETLQKSKQSDISDKLIELSGKIQNIRLMELRAKREGDELKEKNNYLSRLLKSQNEKLKQLQELSAEYEGKLHKQEEEFRKLDNDRMRKFFNARFDDVPGSMAMHNGSALAANIKRNQPAFKDSSQMQGYQRQKSMEQSSLHGRERQDDINMNASSNTNANLHEAKFLESKVRKL